MSYNGINNQIYNNDFTVQKTGAGTTVTSTIQQTSNTASATAKRVISVAGGTAGDAFTNYTVSGVTNWSEGIDNSDSDAYVIAASTALGTTNTARCDTSGRWNYPLQPAFSATPSGALNNVTGDGTTYTVVYASEIFDQNNNFDGTSTFTAPVTGRYLLNTFNTVTNISSSHTSTSIYIVTSNRTYENQLNSYNVGYDIGGSVSQEAHSFTVFADMDAGDTATVQIAVRGGTKTVGLTTASYFQGYLVC